MKRLLILLMLLAFPAMAGAQTNTFCAVNLPCQGEVPVNALASSLSTAVANAAGSGVIHVWPNAGTVVGTGVTIPVGVTLRVDQGALISGNPTINGPIQAGPYQIFTGAPSLGAAATPLHHSWFPGTDMHAQWQNAYNAGPTPPSAFIIYLDPNPSGAGCWTTTTTVSMNTVNKYAKVIALQPGVGTSNACNGFFDNFTPTITGSSATITAISYAGSTVTVTAANSFVAGNVVTVRGVSPTDYNGVWIVATASGTGFTYTAILAGGIAAGSTGTATQSPIAVEVDWTPTSGNGYNNGAGIYDLSMTNNLCFTNFGCGSFAIGVMLGRTNGGGRFATFQGNSIGGFGTGYAKSSASSLGWGVNWNQGSVAWSNVGIGEYAGTENDKMTDMVLSVNGVNLQDPNSEISMSKGSMDTSGTCDVQMSGSGFALLYVSDVHWENFGATNATPRCVVSSGNNPTGNLISIKGGEILDDVVSNAIPSAAWINAGKVMTSNLTVSSGGRGLSGQLITANTISDLGIYDNSLTPLPLASICGGYCSGTITPVTGAAVVLRGTGAVTKTYATPASGTNYTETDTMAPPTVTGAIKTYTTGGTASFSSSASTALSFAAPLIINTAPTIAAGGCGGAAASIVVSNGTAAFKINVGTTPTTACTFTMPSATTGWNCYATDITTNSTSVFLQKQTGAESQTSVTITNFSDVAVATAFTASDILKVACSAD